LLGRGVREATSAQPWPWDGSAISLWSGLEGWAISDSIEASSLVSDDYFGPFWSGCRAASINQQLVRVSTSNDWRRVRRSAVADLILIDQATTPRGASTNSRFAGHGCGGFSDRAGGLGSKIVWIGRFHYLGCELAKIR